MEALIQRLREALREKRHVFVFGNGGSASNASHFVTDLGKGASGQAVQCVNVIKGWSETMGLSTVGVYP